MKIGLGQQNYLVDQLKRHKPDSDLLIGDYENGYPIYRIAEKLSEPEYKKVLALLFNGKVKEAETILKSL